MSVLSLGGIAFNDFELPEEVHFGGRQRHHEHKIIGSNRIIDTMGWDPHPVKWKGRFRGSEAESRARLLIAMASAGVEYPVFFSGQFYIVIIADFKADFKVFYEIPYEIECTVVTDPIGDGVAGVVSTLAAVIGGDLTAIGGLVGGL